MQISDCLRRGVAVPLDDAAALAMERNDLTEATRARSAAIADPAEFEMLWRTGVRSYQQSDRQPGG